MLKKIDINCDMGELDSVNDALFLPYISSCNISCGAHSGSPEKIENTILQAIQNQLKIGAHPSYPDKENFGRKSMNMNRTAFRRTILEQLNFIINLLDKYGEELHHVKAHGALYNDMANDKNKLNDFLDIVKEIKSDVKIYALAIPEVKKIVSSKQLEFVGEAFMDRRYTGDLRLQSRKIEGAVFQDLEMVLTQIDYLIEHKIHTTDNSIQAIQWETICLHSDTPHAVDWCPQIYTHLKNKGIEIA